MHDEMRALAPELPVTGTIRILDFVLSRLGRPSPGRSALVDLPTGSGYLAVRAAALGWKVQPFDLDPRLWRGGADVEVRRADLNERFPLEDASVDVMACCEGIEHAENPWLALREARRVLRPGGRLFVSIPNTIDFRQRLRFLRRGTLGHYFPSVSSHINAMGTVLLAHAMLAAGFTLRGVETERTYYPAFVASVLRPFLRMPKSTSLPDEVRDLLSSREVLLGRTAIFEGIAAG